MGWFYTVLKCSEQRIHVAQFEAQVLQQVPPFKPGSTFLTEYHRVPPPLYRFEMFSIFQAALQDLRTILHPKPHRTQPHTRLGRPKGIRHTHLTLRPPRGPGGRFLRSASATVGPRSFDRSSGVIRSVPARSDRLGE